MKKNISLLLTILLAFNLLVVMANAITANPSLSVECENANPSSTVEISIILDNNPGFAGMDLYITFDTTRLILKNSAVSIGNATESVINDNTTEYSAHWASGTTNVIGNGVLLTLTFQVKADAPFGDAFVNARIGTGSTFYVENQTEVDFSFDVINGTISVDESIVIVDNPITDFTYTTDGNSLIITSYIGSNNVVRIGESYTLSGNDYTVTTIAESAFEANETVASLIIPESLTTIEAYAFFGCTKITSIIIPNSVTSIGRSAFYNCSSLQYVTLGKGIESFGNNVFNACDKLTSIDAPCLLKRSISNSSINLQGKEVAYFHVNGTEKRGAVEAKAAQDGYTGDTYCIGCGDLISKGSVIPAISYAKGDLDGDAEVTPNDISLLIAARLETVTLSTVQITAADIDNNGKIEPADISLLIALRLGTITEFP